jgi:host factor-I protein
VEHGQERTKSGGVNVQDGFFYTLRREGTPIQVYLVTGRRLNGILRRFDRYALIVENHGTEVLIYKHAVASVSIARLEGERVREESD